MAADHTFTITLMRWFRENGRTLPWRGTKDPYAIWLSEIILQQTRISQGTEYWCRFMQKYPTVQHLADASEDDVLRLWQGLGYYSRARNLHTAARQIVQAGKFPDTYDSIRKLKGVGDYTAAAVGSIAFGLPVAAIDGNAYRVMSRYFGIDTPVNSTEGKHVFAQLGRALVPARQAGIYNQAVMDFGALQCTPKSPKCVICPLADSCQALHDHKTGLLPVKTKKTKVSTRHLSYVYLRCNGYAAIHRREAGDIWQGLWEPFNASHLEEDDMLSPEKLFCSLHIQPCRIQPVMLARHVKHVLTHRILYADFYLLELPARPALSPEYIWVPETELDTYGMPRLVQILLDTLHTLQAG